MPVPIIIFSADEIRGRVILNALRFQGHEALLSNMTHHAETLISENIPSVIIFDSKGYSHAELDYFKSAYPLMSNTPLIVLANRSEIDMLELNELRTELCKTDPLDVELIILKVETLLEQKSNSATVQQSNSVEVQRDEEPGDDSESLEDDLKKLLDLK